MYAPTNSAGSGCSCFRCSACMHLTILTAVGAAASGAVHAPTNSAGSGCSCFRCSTCTYQFCGSGCSCFMCSALIYQFCVQWVQLLQVQCIHLPILRAVVHMYYIYVQYVHIYIVHSAVEIQFVQLLQVQWMQLMLFSSFCNCCIYSAATTVLVNMYLCISRATLPMHTSSNKYIHK